MSVPESVTARLIFFVIVSAIVEKKDRTCDVLVRLRHLLLRSCSDPIFRTGLRNVWLGNLERLAEIAIESLGEIARQLEMLLLVLPTGTRSV
jgi:hypothetical protein